MTGRPTVGHLARRFFGSISNAPASPVDLDAVASVLRPEELRLWSTMQHRDQRHSVTVWRRFLEFRPDADLDEQRAALLHDLGKAVSPIGPMRRVLATLLGPVTPALRRYLDHEDLGRSMLDGVSSDRTRTVLRMTPGDPAGEALRRADDV